MMIRLLPVLAFLIFASVPLVLGSAETKEAAKEAAKEAPKEAPKSEAHKTEEAAAPVAAPAHKPSNECLASEEVIQDLEIREKKLKEKETALEEKEKEIAAQSAAVKDELVKLEAMRGEVASAKAKALAEREEKVNKLMETFETMSPKAAAGVLNGVDDELAVTALSRLTSVKSGKILSNLNPDKSSRLSEIMAYGKVTSGKEKARADTTERNPASKR